MEFLAELANAARNHWECTVCLERKSLSLADMCDDRESRVCRHFLCYGCASSLLAKTCPICRAPFERAVHLPSPREDVRLIFRLIDSSGDGHISREELADYCSAFASVSVDAALTALARPWARFDENGDGTLSPLEFQLAVLPILAELYARESESAQIPSLSDEPDLWFSYWDDDNSGLLEIGELLRALCKTFTSLSVDELTCILKRSGLCWITTARMPLISTSSERKTGCWNCCAQTYQCELTIYI
ncbi:hypothetical protein T492DRAFT_1053777 [Pavlovales sp. CCMP2436]|nr:hypothetical protein T492DRAFT_1053777 [Pavlovales sp. CCMP2436]